MPVSAFVRLQRVLDLEEKQGWRNRAVIGGLTGSTLITLVLIPVLYSLFHPETDTIAHEDHED